MSFSLSVSLFFVVAVFYVFIIDVFTMLFRLTGMTQEKAKFQVVSLLTNSGYTTNESELVVEVVTRRKLARVIMLFGYVFSITIVSVFVNVMMSLPQSEKEEIWPALITVSVLFVIFFVVRTVPVVKLAFDQVLEQWARKWYLGGQNNPILIQDEYPRGVIAMITLNVMPPDLDGKTLGELRLRSDYGVHLIFIRRQSQIIMQMDADTKMELHDQVTVFGTRDAIRQIFHAPVQHENPVRQAPRPESEQEYIHQQDVKKAAAAAAAENAAKKAAVQSEKVPASPEARRSDSAPASAEKGGPPSARDEMASGTEEPAAGSGSGDAPAAREAAAEGSPVPKGNGVEKNS